MSYINVYTRILLPPTFTIKQQQNQQLLQQQQSN